MKSDYEKALEFHLQSLQKSEENDDKIGIANAFANIGIIYDKQKLFVKALEYHYRSLQIAREIGDKDGVGGTFSNIAASNISLKKYDVARVWLDSALLFSKATRNKELLISVYRNLAMLDSATGKWNDAYFHYKQYILYRDSLLNEENTEKTVRAEMNFDFERKEQIAKAEQERKDVIAMEEKQKQRIIIYSVTLGFILILILTVVIFRSLRQNQVKNKLITEQKKQVEEKQKEVIDSIRYAQKIQKAHLPSDKLVMKMMERMKKG